MTDFTGDSGDNNLVGTSLSETFDISQGGIDTVSAGDGEDGIYVGAALTALDQVDGGAGFDTLRLDGDYSAGLVFSATTIVSIETIRLSSGHDYRLTIDNANTSATDGLYVYGVELGAANHLFFDGRAETAQGISVYGGHGADTMLGGGGNDVISLINGGDDFVRGMAGDDQFYAPDGLTGADSINGGKGNDLLFLNGDYAAGVVFTATTLTEVETIIVSHGHSYALTLADATTRGSHTLVVTAGEASYTLLAGETLDVNGSAETNGHLDLRGGGGDDQLVGGKRGDYLTGGAGDDTLNGGKGTDLITGGAGQDFLKGAGGPDTFAFGDGDSTTAAPDFISKLQGADTIDLSAIDADTGTALDQAFTQVGAFSHAAGQLVLSYDAGTDRTSVMMDVDGDAVADMTILVKGDQTAFTHFVL